MSIKVNRIVTNDGLKARKPPLCRTCGQRDDAVLTRDANGDLIHARHLGAQGDPVRQPRSLRGQEGE